MKEEITMAPKHSYFNKDDNFVMSDFDMNYKYKGFIEEQFKPTSRKFMKLTGHHVSPDENNAVIVVGDNNIFKTPYGYAIILNAEHVVFVKDWQVWGMTRNGDYIINLNREFYKVKEWGDFSENFGYEKDNLLFTFEGVLTVAREQEASYNDGFANDNGYYFEWA